MDLWLLCLFYLQVFVIKQICMSQVQDHKGISNAAPTDCPLLALPIPDVEGHSSPEMLSAMEARIHDYISDLRFSISPAAFFQVRYSTLISLSILLFVYILQFIHGSQDYTG